MQQYFVTASYTMHCSIPQEYDKTYKTGAMVSCRVAACVLLSVRGMPGQCSVLSPSTVSCGPDMQPCTTLQLVATCINLSMGTDSNSEHCSVCR